MSTTWSSENELYSEVVCTTGSETGDPPTLAPAAVVWPDLPGPLEIP